jgi:glyoxylase-like metal-dependent hydrolase (beta-lactamase superfamily II)
LFTGDTLFVGDVGRPDLSSGNKTKEELAAIMYDTLQKKILTLPDDVLVYPRTEQEAAVEKILDQKLPALLVNKSLPIMHCSLRPKKNLLNQLPAISMLLLNIFRSTPDQQRRI